VKATASGPQVRWFGFASWQWTLGLALLVLGFLIAAQLQSEAPRTTYTSQERQPLVQTALELQTQQDQLKQRVLDLRTQIQQLEQRSQGNQATGQQLNGQLQEARIAGGLVGLRGTGLVIQLDDSTNTIPVGANETDYRVSAADVRTVVQELWLAGAEAIAVNGERVTVSSGLIDIGGSVLLNSAYLAPPYQVSAIGPADLYGRLTASPAFVGFVRARADTFGIKISYAQPSEVTVPAFAGSVTLRYGRPEQPGASSSPAAP
jgi:uncharacterized protein YlxW (UPF0749 family)